MVNRVNRVNYGVILYKSKTLSDGTHPIMLRLSQGKQRKLQSTGYSATIKEWDGKRNRVKGHALQNTINKKLIDLENRYAEAILELEKFSEKDYSIDTVILKADEMTNEPVKKVFVKEFIDDQIKRLEKQGKTGTASTYKSTRYSFFNYYSGNDLRFSELNYNILQRYNEYLNARDVKGTTKSHYFRALRAIYNKAIKEGAAPKRSNPFEDFRINKFNTETTPRAIPRKTILKIIKYDQKKLESNYYDLLALHYLIFAYYSGGINFIDFAKLKWLNIQDDKIIYERSKTTKPIIFPLRKENRDIVNYYKPMREDENSYIFPVIKPSHDTPISIQNRIKKVRHLVNKKLKDIGKEYGVQNLTTYVIRHSVASHLRELGVPVSHIQEIYGHRTEKQTYTYLAKLNRDDIDESLNKL